MSLPLIHRAALGAAAVVLAIAGLTARPGAAERMVEDLPLMQGLNELTERRTVFNSASGRIAEIVAQGRVAPDLVVKFYADTLPQLGWETTPGGSYRRGDEVLRIEITEGTNGVTVRFAISPQ